MRRRGRRSLRDRYRIAHKCSPWTNGLLIVHEDHRRPVVAAEPLGHHVGSRNEQRGKTGFAHLFEHFFFNGSENYPHGFREAMDDLGANNRNGTNGTDRTNFFEDVPVSALERTLYLEADRMGFLAERISNEMLERERGVVQNEKRQGENQPYGACSPDGRDPLSDGAPLQLVDYRQHGRPQCRVTRRVRSMRDLLRTDNCVLSLAGDITPERALELVKI